MPRRKLETENYVKIISIGDAKKIKKSKKKKLKDDGLPLMQLSEIELLRIAKSDAEVKNAVQLIKEIDQKVELENLKHQNDLNELKNSIDLRMRQHEHEISRLQHERLTASQFAKGKAKVNDEVVDQIATKFSLDPKHLLIDMETGIVKDQRTLVPEDQKNSSA